MSVPFEPSPRHLLGILGGRRSTRTFVLPLAGIAILLVSCGTTRTISQDDATSSFERVLQPTPEQLRCMRERFAEADVAAVMDAEREPSDDQRRSFASAARTCIPIERFADLLATSLGEAIDGATEAQADCVRSLVTSMPADEQDRLYVYFANPAALNQDEVQPAIAKLTAACRLTGTNAPEPEVGPPTPSPAPPATGSGS